MGDCLITSEKVLAAEGARNKGRHPGECRDDDVYFLGMSCRSTSSARGSLPDLSVPSVRS
jgi:hypothetical protein